MPGDAMLEPAAVLALGVLIVNDHWAKARFPGIVTGKLSDFAGMIFFPLLLVALIELARAGLSADARPSSRTLVACVLATGLIFAATKTWAPAAGFYQDACSVAQYPLRAARAWLSGGENPGLLPVRHTMDPTDLVALPALVIPLLLGEGRVARERPSLARVEGHRPARAAVVLASSCLRVRRASRASGEDA